MKLDGFFFDAPDGYIGAGNAGKSFWKYNPALMREAITDVIRNVSGGRAGAFAEIYNDPPLVDAFGFDGGLGDSKLCRTHSAKTCPASPRASAIGMGITTGNASLIESAMSGPGSVDDMAAQIFRAPDYAYRATYMSPPVALSWLPNTSMLEMRHESLNCERIITHCTVCTLSF